MNNWKKISYEKPPYYIDVLMYGEGEYAVACLVDYDSDKYQLACPYPDFCIGDGEDALIIDNKAWPPSSCCFEYWMPLPEAPEAENA